MHDGIRLHVAADADVTCFGGVAHLAQLRDRLVVSLRTLNPAVASHSREPTMIAMRMANFPYLCIEPLNLKYTPFASLLGTPGAFTCSDA